ACNHLSGPPGRDGRIEVWKREESREMKEQLVTKVRPDAWN
ncbi:unnamed protein product, partial [Cercopithifilaria johnstoni]